MFQNGRYLMFGISKVRFEDFEFRLSYAWCAVFV
jgi:hypothetical protein